ncbi:MAG: M20/M25/M40 family metallo-hydrolase [Candidatus Lindowbacteria bacterium]|nr:M20/M25/M40 family metallo-hydrolase [Candidatus Lindowbacteria bacterium]
MNDIDWKTATEEATRYLVDLVRFDTTNPPGNETECARYVAGLLSKEGIEPLVLESAPGRGNVIGRLKGDGSKKPLLLMSHLDVVHAESSRWEVPPFSGEMRDGVIWGRGTLDTKGLTAMHLMTMFLLKRNGVPLKRDIILMGNADEEAGAKYGAEWMVNNHFDKIKAEFALNEGGVGMKLGSKTVFMCSNAEKGLTWVKLTAKGRAGHGSMPHSDNATLHIARAITNITNYRAPIVVTDTLRHFIKVLAKADARAHLLKLAGAPLLGRLILKLVKDDMVKVMLWTTITPTVIKGGVKVNVIPDSCELMVDCRLLPGVTREDLESLLLGIVDSDKIKLEFEVFNEATESPIETEIFSVIEQVITSNYPDGLVSPLMMSGGTDSRFLRLKGVPAYGFAPLILSKEDISSIHGANEKVSIANYASALRTMYHVISTLSA